MRTYGVSGSLGSSRSKPGMMSISGYSAGGSASVGKSRDRIDYSEDFCC